MATLSLREAAERTGTSKSTIFRAIKAGRLSGAKDDDGNFAIDPAELFRVYPPKDEGDAPAQLEKRLEGQGAIPSDTVELRIRNAEIAAELRVLRQLLEAMQKREEELKAERDRWANQAERLAIAPPLTTAPQGEVPGGWWPFRRRA